MTDHRTPANDRLIVREIMEDQKTQGGIIIADAFESSVKKTKILAVSEHTKAKYSVGHYAWLQKTAGIELPEGDLVISEGHILYVTEE